LQHTCIVMHAFFFLSFSVHACIVCMNFDFCMHFFLLLMNAFICVELA
jgi:hypothetical protein